MRKAVLFLGALILLLSCGKETPVDHNISAEFPLQETLQAVNVLFAEEGQADIVIGTEVKGSLDGVKVTDVDGGKVIRFKSLAIFVGNADEDLLERTFWQDPSLQWIYKLDSDAMEEDFQNCGFVHALRARGLSGDGTTLFAASNVYDKISALSVSPLSFTVKVREEAL